MRALQVIIGVILLFPGLCSLVTFVTTLPWVIESFFHPEKYPNFHLSGASVWLVIWGICFLVSWGGWVLLRGPKSNISPRSEDTENP